MIQQLKLGLVNAFLVTGSKAILVDSGTPGQADRILHAAARHGVAPHDIAAIVHTHGHFDHCGSTAELRRRAGMTAAIHVGDAEKLRSGRPAPPRHTPVVARAVMALMDTSFEPVEPDILLNEGFDLRQFGLAATIVPTPGHTAGSVSVLFHTGEAIVGDLLFGGFLLGKLMPTWPRYPALADDYEQVRASVEKLLSLGARRFYVGHGGPLDYNQVLIRLSLTARHVAHPAPASI